MTKAKEIIKYIEETDKFNDYYILRDSDAETIREALELLDKVQRGGVDVQQIDELQTLSDDEWLVLTDKYILIERE